MERLNYNHLFYFYIIAKEGSIKAACEKLHLSQPTLSDQLKLLEEHFGQQLFERKNRSLQLNRAGKTALEYAEEIFSLGIELTSRLRHSSKLPKSSLDVGITPAMSQYFVYDELLPLFSSQEMEVRVHEAERQYLIADLELGELDLIISDSKEPLSRSLIAYRMGMSRTYVICGEKYKNLRSKFPKCLNDIPFFNYTDQSFLRYEIELFFRQNGLSPRVVGEGDDIDLLQMVTENNIGFTIVSEVAMKKFKQISKIFVLGELEGLQTSIWGIVKKNDQGLAYKFLTNKI